MSNVTAVGSFNPIQAAMRANREGSGFTIRPEESSKPLVGTNWLVGGYIPALLIARETPITSVVEQIKEWYSAASLTSHNPIIGGWVQYGTLHLDVVTDVPEFSAAVSLGKIWGQDAIGHITADGTYIEHVLYAEFDNDNNDDNDDNTHNQEMSEA